MDAERQYLLQRMDSQVEEKFDTEFLDKLANDASNTNGSVVDKRMLEIVQQNRQQYQNLKDLPLQVSNSVPYSVTKNDCSLLKDGHPFRQP